MNIISILKTLHTRSKSEIAQWAIENFNVQDLDNLCKSEVAREIRNLTIRVSMYMETASDSQKQAATIAIISILISVCALIISSAIAIAKP